VLHDSMIVQLLRCLAEGPPAAKGFPLRLLCLPGAMEIPLALILRLQLLTTVAAAETAGYADPPQRDTVSAVAARPI